MEHAEPHLKWAMEVCFNPGTRPGESELLSLRWDEVDFAAGTARIYASKELVPHFWLDMKNNK